MKKIMNGSSLVTIIHEDNHLLVVNKPAGMPSQPDESGAESLVDWAHESIRRRHDKPGNVFVGLVHRLDQPVSGVVVLARTGKAAARLSAQFRAGTVVKTYWAIVEGFLEEEEGVLSDRLAKDRRTTSSASWRKTTRTLKRPNYAIMSLSEEIKPACSNWFRGRGGGISSACSWLRAACRSSATRSMARSLA